jgi:hypothetical protein
MNPHQPQNQSKPSTYEDLTDGMFSTNQYDHLKIILSHQPYAINQSPQHYLYVSHDSFGIIRLMDVDYDNDQVYIRMRNELGNEETITIDINDSEIKMLLINLDDIKRLVINDID